LIEKEDVKSGCLSNGNYQGGSDSTPANNGSFDGSLLLLLFIRHGGGAAAAACDE
jgi:hypothetical protein